MVQIHFTCSKVWNFLIHVLWFMYLSRSLSNCSLGAVTLLLMKLWSWTYPVEAIQICSVQVESLIVLRTSGWCRCVRWWFWLITGIWKHPFPCLCLGRSIDKFRASRWNGRMLPVIQTRDSHSLGSTVLSILSPISLSRFPEKRRVRIHNTSLENSQLPTVFSSRDFLNLVWYLQLSMNSFLNSC